MRVRGSPRLVASALILILGGGAWLASNGPVPALPDGTDSPRSPVFRPARDPAPAIDPEREQHAGHPHGSEAVGSDPLTVDGKGVDRWAFALSGYPVSGSIDREETQLPRSELLDRLAGGGGDGLAMIVLLLDGRGACARAARDAIRLRFGEDRSAFLGAVADLLQHDLAEVRRRAVDVLGRHREWPPVVFPALLAAGDDPDWIVRHRASQALATGPLSTTQVAELALRLGARLLEEDRDDRWETLGFLEQMGPRARSALPRILPLLEVEDASVRRQAIAILGAIGPGARDTIPALVHATWDPELVVRHEAVLALGRIPDARAVPALTRAADAEDLDIREAAVDALGRIGGPKVVATLTRLLIADDDLRSEVLVALGRIGLDAASAVPTIRDLVRDQNEVDRVTADALGRIGGPVSVRVLVEALREEREGAPEALRALGLIGPSARTALPLLLEARKNAELARHATLAISRIGGPEAEEILIRALEEEDRTLRLMAIRALGRLRAGGLRTVAGLGRALEDDDRDVRAAAARALADFGAEARTAERALRAALEYEPRSPLMEAAEALGRLGVPVEHLLLTGLDSAHEDERLAAARALGSLGLRMEAATGTLLPLLEDRDRPTTREAAIEALGEFGPRTLIPTLEALLGDPCDEIHLAAVDALRRLRTR